jgi:hypothetical protein
MTSATEIRNAWPKLDELGKIELIKGMYPKEEMTVPKVKKISQILDSVLIGELVESFVDPDQSKQYWNHDPQRSVSTAIEMPLRDNDRRGRRQGYNEGEDTEILDEVAPAVWSAARVAAPWLLKQGWKIIKGTSKVAVKNPKSAIAVGTGVAYKDEIKAVAEYLKGIGETIEPVLKYAKQYALPVMAVFALMYGGKKIHDMLTDNDPEAEPDEETPILGRGEDGELADIRKLSGLDEAKRKPRPDIDDDDDEEDEGPAPRRSPAFVERRYAAGRTSAASESRTSGDASSRRDCAAASVRR